MCIAIPMKIIAAEGLAATCEAEGRRERVTLELTGPLKPGSWVLVFQGAAQRAMNEAEAQQALAALTALSDVMAGKPSGAALDAAFADITARTGELPAFLKRA